MKVTSLNYKGLPEFDVTIVGELPEGRWDQVAIMNRRYLDQQLEAFKGNTGADHTLADKCMSLIWIRLPNKQSLEALSDKVMAPGQFQPVVKMELASSAIASFLDPYKDIFSFLRWVLTPALLITMTVVISNAISISVRERRGEMAVLKVLGFRPNTVMGMVLGESLLVGTLSGFMASATALVVVNIAFGGLAIPIGFFNKFMIPGDALWWGPLMGFGTALIGTIVPALSARSIKVSEVFSRVS